MSGGNGIPGYKWRSANWFIIACIAIALFSENFLYSYIVPILQVILEQRLHVDESKTQATTSLVLTVHALVCLVSGPLTGYLADKCSNRQLPLLASLGAELVGTVIIMVAPSVPVLLIGRAFQAIGGNAVWIVGLATVADTVGQEDTGKVLGGISSFFVSGLLFGPMAAGTLLDLIGYWMTWMVPIALLVVDMIMRLVMIENKNGTNVPMEQFPTENPSNEYRDSEENARYDERTYIIENRDSADDEFEDQFRPYYDDPEEETDFYRDEQSALHSSPSLHPPNRYEVEPRSLHTSDTTRSLPRSSNFYKMILSDPRAVAALTCNFTQGVILVSLDTTLPLHCSNEFGWTPAKVSLMFLLLQIPSFILATPAGALKDKVGTKLPTSVGFFCIAFFMWLLGTAGTDGLSFVGSGSRGQATYMVAVVGIGMARTMISGCGTIEITNLMKEYQRQNAGQFGSNNFSSGYSMTNFCWTAGMLVGPILSGFLTRTVGYYYMNFTCAMISWVVGLLGMAFLPSKKGYRS
ncbi:hypothetical protein N7540_004507 [Penicillium herquei]|nr:hypothetical protein N7540_004507 [Penicillium herquei]